MADPLITEPLPGESAFDAELPNASWSRAAQIAGLARQLTGDAGSFLDEYADEVERLKLPRLLIPAGFSLVGAGPAQFVDDSTRSLAEAGPDEASAVITNLQRAAWVQAYQDSDPAAAAAVVYLGLYHPDDVIRLVAAAGVARFTGKPTEDVIDLLADGCFSDSETLRGVSADALGEVSPEHPVFTFMASDEAGGPAAPAHTSIMVHGTWARWKRRRLPVVRSVKGAWRQRRNAPAEDNPLWWQPGGDFNHYIYTTVSNDLYQADDYYRWAGGHRRLTHRQAAEDLRTWCANHGTPRLRDVYAHSHGGTVVLRAANLGQEMTLAVFLSVPPLGGSMKWHNIGRAVSLRSHFDIVLILDLSPKRLPDPVRELDLPSWFSHPVTHDVDFWTRNDLPNQIAYERAQSTLP